MKQVMVLIKKELEVAQLQTKIRKQVEEKMSEHQRKFFLREQLKAIQKEWGFLSILDKLCREAWGCS